MAGDILLPAKNIAQTGTAGEKGRGKITVFGSPSFFPLYPSSAFHYLGSTAPQRMQGTFALVDTRYRVKQSSFTNVIFSITSREAHAKVL